MKIIEITTAMDTAIATVVDAALKNPQIGGLNIKPHVDYILFNIKEKLEATDPSKPLQLPPIDQVKEIVEEAPQEAA